MAEKLVDNKHGIHYVKNAKEKPKIREQLCNRCRKPATCIGRLYVPPSTFSPVWHDGLPVTVLLAGLFWCDYHFFQLKAEQFLTGEGGSELRDAIVHEFRRRQQYPSFGKALIGRIPRTDPEYLSGLKAVEITMRGSNEALKPGQAPSH